MNKRLHPPPPRTRTVRDGAHPHSGGTIGAAVILAVIVAGIVFAFGFLAGSAA